MRKQWNQNRCSFTLVELLVVIVIIGLLAALITQTVMAAMTAAREATIKFEVGGLATAMSSYKAQYGEYPPDFSDITAVERHVRLRWPRITNVGLNRFKTAPYSTMTRAQALVFWLRGFSGNPTDPLNPSNPQGTPSFEFDKARLVDMTTGLPVTSTTALPVYIATHGSKSADGSTLRPYIYFDGRTYASNNAVFQGKRPYLSDLTLETYAAQDSFQIIHPGLDGEWGQTTANTASYPSGTGYLPDDRDNITNFCRGRTLDDDIP